MSLCHIYSCCRSYYVIPRLAQAVCLRGALDEMYSFAKCFHNSRLHIWRLIDIVENQYFIKCAGVFQSNSTPLSRSHLTCFTCVGGGVDRNRLNFDIDCDFLGGAVIVWHRPWYRRAKMKLSSINQIEKGRFDSVLITSKLNLKLKAIFVTKFFLFSLELNTNTLT